MTPERLAEIRRAIAHSLIDAEDQVPDGMSSFVTWPVAARQLLAAYDAVLADNERLTADLAQIRGELAAALADVCGETMVGLFEQPLGPCTRNLDHRGAHMDHLGQSWWMNGPPSADGAQMGTEGLQEGRGGDGTARVDAGSGVAPEGAQEARTGFTRQWSYRATSASGVMEGITMPEAAIRKHVNDLRGRGNVGHTYEVIYRELGPWIVADETPTQQPTAGTDG